MKRSHLIAAAAATALAAAAGYVWSGSLAPKPEWRFAAADRGPLVASVSSTGTLNAVITVQVGSQVSGQIRDLLADFNSEVGRGQVIARIDPEMFEAKVRQAEADLEVARAAVASQRAQVERVAGDLANAVALLAVAKANTEKSEAVLREAKRDFERRRELFQKGVTNAADFDKAEGVHAQAQAQRQAAAAQEIAQQASIVAARAQVRAAEAAVENALAVVRQKEAYVRQAQIDLDHTFIRAPVDGVVVSRNVDIGQTVAASLQAPILFLIAQDLARMQVNAAVDEADVGRVKVGQRASFTVDAFRGERFEGEVTQIRKSPQVIQNVVTYDVVIAVDNKDLKLLPGMTANLRILVAERGDALRVPSAALRFRPPDAEGETAVRRARATGAGRPDGVAGRVWMVGENGVPMPLSLKLGISDGEFTEVLAGDLAAGQRLIVGAMQGPQPKSPTQGRGPRFGL